MTGARAVFQPDYLLIGHVTKDLLPAGGFTIGGTVSYAGATAHKLGARVAVVTAAAGDLVLPRELAGLAWHVKPSPATSTFRNEYTAAGRRQIIGPVALPLGPADVPPAWRRAPMIHLAPLTGELAEDIVLAFPHSKVVATAQGWLRQWDERGVVRLKSWPEASRLLPHLHSLVFSDEDVQGDWALIEAWAALTPTLVVTQGARGCTVFHHGQRRQIPPRPAQEVEPTGAGDIFAAAFFIRYCQTDDPWAAARFANVVASRSVEAFGLSGVPNMAGAELMLAGLDVPR